MFGCIFNAILYYALAPKSVISHEKFNNVWPTVEVRSLNTFTVGMNVMNAFELFFFQVGKMVQHTSLMTLKNKLRAQVWICFAFSLIDAGSQLYKQAQILTKIYWSLLISGAECSTVFFDLTMPRPLNFSLVIMIDYNWECRSPCVSPVAQRQATCFFVIVFLRFLSLLSLPAWVEHITGSRHWYTHLGWLTTCCLLTWFPGHYLSQWLMASCQWIVDNLS